ncbi:MAG TPA: Ig-like domain-containing protein [Nitrososphaeraceae archaeon]|nr:Ig-like domain-containing protein [Nitrososphaeraceae archaeon]
MKLKLFVLAILFVTVSLLIVPDLTHTPVLGQADKSFKGTVAPFVPPSSSERLGSLSGNNFEFDDVEVEGDQEQEEEEEIDRDELPVLTQRERDEFLSDNIDAIEADRLIVLSQKETINDDIDPISSIVKEIVKNETIISDEEFVPSPESSIIKFKDENLEQILDAQEVAPEPDNQTIRTAEGGELPLNVTEDDFEIELADEISESESPDVEVQSFINETAIEEATAPTDNETAITTEDTVEEEATAPTDNETAITTEDTVEGKPSELLEMDPEVEDEIQDIEEEQQTEQAQQEEDEAQTPQVEEEEQQTEQAQQEEDEAQTPQVEEEAPNTEPTAQDGSVITSQNQQLNIKLNAKDADGDNLSFTIVDDPSNGQLGNVNPSTNTVTYTPDEDYSGEDNFTFIVNDGTIDSNEATVSISVVEEEQTEQAQQEEEEEQTEQAQQEEEEEESQQKED